MKTSEIRMRLPTRSSGLPGDPTVSFLDSASPFYAPKQRGTWPTWALRPIEGCLWTTCVYMNTDGVSMNSDRVFIHPLALQRFLIIFILLECGHVAILVSNYAFYSINFDVYAVYYINFDVQKMPRLRHGLRHAYGALRGLGTHVTWESGCATGGSCT